jgi:replicative DNA helicase
MRALIRRVRRQHKRCDFLVLDYLQLADADTKTENEAARLTKISNGLKQIAREFQIPVIALSQMNNEYLKRGWNIEPHVGDLKGSGSIAQDSDVVMFLWPLNGSDEGDNRRHLILRKNRGGKKDVKVPLIFRGDLAQFLPGDPDTFYPAGEMEASPRQNVRQRSRNLMAAY